MDILKGENLLLAKQLSMTSEEAKALKQQNESNKSLDSILQCQKEKYLSEIAKLKEHISEQNRVIQKQSNEYMQLYQKYTTAKMATPSLATVASITEAKAAAATATTPKKEGGHVLILGRCRLRKTDFSEERIIKKKCYYE